MTRTDNKPEPVEGKGPKRFRCNLRAQWSTRIKTQKLSGPAIAQTAKRLGYLTVRFREGIEDFRYGLDSYMVPGPLHRIPLSQLNVGDSRFTLEAIAEHVAQQLKIEP